MKFKYEYVLSKLRLYNHEQIFGDEALKILKDMGLSFVHVDDTGEIRALNQKNEVLQHYYLYRKKIPVIE